jgi:Bacterial protein of unknown function (DUF937)
MATNLVSLIMQFLTPDMIGRIAAALGLDRNAVQSAVGAAVPGLLAAFGGAAAQPGSAQKLADAAGQHADALGNFAGMLGGGGQTAFVEKGSQLLSSLLGGKDQNALAGAIGKFAGLSPGASGSLLGMLAPVIMGTVGQQQGARSANGIASLLAAQKDNIATALPAGFGNLLAGTGLLDSLGGAARTATAAGRQTAQATASAAQAAAHSAERAVGTTPALATNWRYWLIPLLAIAALLAYMLNRPTEQTVQQGATSAQSLMVGGVDIGKQVNDGINNLRSTLDGVTDPASAQTALPKLQDATSQFDKVGAMVAQLSPEQKKILAGLVTPALPALNQLFDKVLAIPGVAQMLKPAIDAVKAKLAMLTA